MTPLTDLRRHLGGALVASLLFLAVTPPAHAQDAQAVAAAESLFQAGKGLMAQSKFEEACPKFAESYRLNPLPGTSLNLANCYKQSGKTASAWAQFREAAFQARKNNQAERDAAATQEAAALEPILSKLQINAEQTPGLVIRRDNQEVGAGALGTAIPVDPGSHTIEATAPGYSVWSTSVVIGKEKDNKVVTIPLLQKNADAEKVAGATGPNKGLRTASYVAGGLGVAGLVVGGVFGGLAAGAKSTLKTECPNNVCPTGQAADDLASAKSKATISTIGIAAGGALLATGVVLFIVSGGKSEPKDEAKPEPKAALVPVFGPQGGGFSFNATF